MAPAGRRPALDVRQARKFEALLRKERVEILVWLDRWPADGSLGRPQSHHPAEAAADLYDQEETVSIKVMLLERLAEVDAALQRLIDGTYGRCEACGMPIPQTRLVALPTARLRVECQQWAEREPGQALRSGC